MSRRKSCVWLMAAAGLWTGCAAGPFCSRGVAPPVDLSAVAMTPAPRPLTGDELRIMRVDLATGDAGLADQAAGIDGVPTNYGWCPNCGNVELKNGRWTCRCRGGGSGSGHGGHMTAEDRKAIRKALAVALSALLCTFLIVDLAFPD